MNKGLRQRELPAIVARPTGRNRLKSARGDTSSALNTNGSHLAGSACSIVVVRQCTWITCSFDPDG
jgi:hypothetical protein